MYTASAIDPLTIQAYLETEYWVLREPVFTLRIGHASPDLLSAHKRQKVGCGAFLTACNPFSKSFDEAANKARQAALAHELSRRNLVFLPVIGQASTRRITGPARTASWCSGWRSRRRGFSARSSSRTVSFAAAPMQFRN